MSPLDLTEIAEKLAYGSRCQLGDLEECDETGLCAACRWAMTQRILPALQSAVSQALQEAAREFTELVTPMILMGTITDQVAEAVADWLRARAAQGDPQETERA